MRRLILLPLFLLLVGAERPTTTVTVKASEGWQSSAAIPVLTSDGMTTLKIEGTWSDGTQQFEGTKTVWLLLDGVAKVLAKPGSEPYTWKAPPGKTSSIQFGVWPTDPRKSAGPDRSKCTGTVKVTISVR